MDILEDVFPEQKLAPKRWRMAAASIDLFIILSTAFVISLFFGETHGLMGDSGTGYHIGFSLSGFPALTVLLIWFLLFPIMEGLTGRTIGKRLLQLKVVKENSAPMSVGTSFVRHLFDPIEMIFLMGLIVASANSKKQRIGDLVAKTLVIYEH